MSDDRPEKYVFISSTISDLGEERDFVKRYLETYPHVSISCLLSEATDFPVTPPSLAKDTYRICLDNLRVCAYVIQLLNRRYGVPDIQDATQVISIMHKEYREAFSRRLPVFTLVHRSLWRAYNQYKQGKQQDYADPREVQLLPLLDEIQGHPRKKWIFRYETLSDIGTILQSSFLAFDDSVFVGDITFPDGAIVQVGQVFEKIWELRNNGFCIWEHRLLREENPGCGLEARRPVVPIPRTLPGQNVQMAVTLMAPKYPGNYQSYWKMVRPNGEYCFAWKKGIWCRVKVVY